MADPAIAVPVPEPGHMRVIDGCNIYVGDDVGMATNVLLKNHNTVFCRFPGISVYECDYWSNGNKYYFHIPDETLIKAEKRRHFTIANKIRGPRK